MIGNSRNKFLTASSAVVLLVLCAQSVRSDPPTLPGGGSISFDPNSLPARVTLGDRANQISVGAGTYTPNGGQWSVKNVVVTVVPTNGGPNGANVTSPNVQGGKWGGGNGAQPDGLIIVNSANNGAFPTGTYNVQASITFSAKGQNDLTTYTNIVVVTIP